MAGVLVPLKPTNAILTSSTAAEPGPGETAWTSGATFALGARAILGSPTSTVTMTIASPGVVTWSTHGLPDGTKVVLTTTGALPTGLTAGTIYYVIASTGSTFQLSADLDGGPIVTSGSQSGTHTATAQLHRIYESVIAGNTGNPPAIDDGTKWLDVGPTNRWAALDVYRNTRTWQASPLTIVLTPGERVDSLFLGGMVADAVTIAVPAGSYSESIDLRSREVLTWFDYFTKAFTTKPSVLKLDIPSITAAVITVTLTRSAGLVGCGALVIGSSTYLGRTQHGAEAEARNFSKVDRDEFGEAVLQKRRSVPKSNQTIMFAKANTKTIMDLIDALNAEPAVWYGIDEDDQGYFEALLILGIYKTMRLNLAQPNDGILTGEFEEI